MEGTIPSSSIAWVGIIFSLIGGFIAILVTISLVFQRQIKKEIEKIQSSIQGKLNVTDYEKESKIYDENLRASFKATYERMGDRLDYTNRKFCGHSHTADGKIVIGGM
jgi:hypothetical protein